MVYWHEDFEDEPSVEERMPFGLSPEEMRAVSIEASLDICENCHVQLPDDEFVVTGMDEYCTMDIDPGTKLCSECYDERRMQFIPSDPSLFDCFTPAIFD